MTEFRVIEQLKAEIQRLHDGPPERTYRELAKEFGMDHGNLQKFLNGDKEIGLKRFANICEKLKFELKQIEQPKSKRK